MIYRIVFGFAGSSVGWAETHAMLNSATNPNDLMPTLLDLASKRALMLGREFAIVAIRASRYATEADVRTRGAALVKRRIVNTNTGAKAAAEPGDVALVTRGTAKPGSVAGPFDANQNQTFLGAPLDVCVDNAGVVDRGAGGLDAAFNDWRTAIKAAHFGWLGSQTILEFDIEAISQNANGTVRIVTTTPLLATLVQGAVYRLRLRGVNNGHSPLNGEVLAKVQDTFTLDTREVIGIPTEQVGGQARVYKKVQPFIEYGDVTLNETVGNHKRGRPFGSTPGRARRRIRG